MTDILDEIEQDLRKDRMRRFWLRWGWLVVGAAVIFVLAVAGWRGYVGWQNSRAASFGDRYLQSIEAAERGDHDAAIRELEGIVREAPGGYPALARFRLAASLAGKGDSAGAIAAFDALAADTSLPQSFRDVARLRAGLLLADTAPYADVQRRLEPVAANGNPFRHTARELLGLAAYRTDERETAARWFRDLVADPLAPETARNRGSLALTMLAADGVTPPQR
jgi:hypothetical protein